MAEYLIQDTTLTAIGDSIRAKEESSDPIPVSEIASRIAAIETGVTVQRASGTLTTKTSGSVTVNCGFQPDLVFLTKDYASGNDLYSAAAAFAEETRSGTVVITMLCGDGSDAWSESIYITRTSTGFSAKAYYFYDFNSGETAYATTYSYVAVKYT